MMKFGKICVKISGNLAAASFLACRKRDLQDLRLPPSLRVLPVVHGPHRGLRGQVGGRIS